MSTKTVTKQKVTPPELAKRWGVAPEKIIFFILSGELRAIDATLRRGGKPIFDRVRRPIISKVCEAVRELEAAEDAEYEDDAAAHWERGVLAAKQVTQMHGATTRDLSIVASAIERNRLR